MNSKLVLVSALAAGVMTAAGMAQTTTPAAPAAPTKAAAPPPQAVTAKIALIELEEVAAATNEGQKASQEILKKYEPTKARLDALRADIDALTKQLQSAPASMSDAEKATRARDIDTKQKQFQRDTEDAQSSYQADVEEAIGKIIRKLGPVVVKYVQGNGYNLLLDNTGQPQQGGLNVLWGGTDISQAIVDVYNASTPSIAAPVPSAPTANHPAQATPRPKPAAPKQ